MIGCDDIDPFPLRPEFFPLALAPDGGFTLNRAVSITDLFAGEEEVVGCHFHGSCAASTAAAVLMWQKWSRQPSGLPACTAITASRSRSGERRVSWAARSVPLPGQSLQRGSWQVHRAPGCARAHGRAPQYPAPHRNWKGQRSLPEGHGPGLPHRPNGGIRGNAAVYRKTAGRMLLRFTDPGQECIWCRKGRNGVWLVDNHGHPAGKGACTPGLPVLFCRLDSAPHMDMDVNCCRENKKARAVDPLVGNSPGPGMDHPGRPGS